MQGGHTRGAVPAESKGPGKRECFRPHWAMASRLLVPLSMAHTGRAGTAGRGRRISPGFLGSSISLRASSSPASNPQHSLSTGPISMLPNPIPIIQDSAQRFLQSKGTAHPLTALDSRGMGQLYYASSQPASSVGSSPWVRPGMSGRAGAA